MMHYDKSSPKPSLMLSNMKAVEMLNLGTLTKAQRDAADRVETTRVLICTYYA